jgi:hypothetical protein
MASNRCEILIINNFLLKDKFPIMLDSAKNSKSTPKYRGLITDPTNFTSTDTLPKDTYIPQNGNKFISVSTSKEKIRRPVALKEKSSNKTEVKAPASRPLTQSLETDKKRGNTLNSLTSQIKSQSQSKKDKVSQSKESNNSEKVRASTALYASALTGQPRYQNFFEDPELKTTAVKSSVGKKPRSEEPTAKETLKEAAMERSKKFFARSQKERTQEEKEKIVQQSMQEYKKNLINHILSSNENKEAEEENHKQRRLKSTQKKAKRKASKKNKTVKTQSSDAGPQLAQDSHSPAARRRKGKGT